MVEFTDNLSQPRKTPYIDLDNAVLWWAKGGKLKGQSPKRIAYLRSVIEGLGAPLDPYHHYKNPPRTSRLLVSFAQCSLGDLKSL